MSINRGNGELNCGLFRQWTINFIAINCIDLSVSTWVNLKNKADEKNKFMKHTIFIQSLGIKVLVSFNSRYLHI